MVFTEMLLTQPFYFANCTDNLSAATPAVEPGTNFSAGASNADDVAVSVLTAVPHDIHFLVVGFAGFNLTAVNGRALADLLIDPAGGSSWSSLIDDLVCGFTTITNVANAVINCWYCFPLWIKSGASLGARARTIHTVAITTGRCVIYAYGNPSRPDMWWCGQKVESLGINAATSSGTSITPGNSGAFGSWTSIGATTGARYGAIQFGLNGTNATATGTYYHFEIGYGSTRLPGSPTMAARLETSEVAARNFQMPIWCDIPAGTQMQARGKCDATAEIWNCALYGVH
jgi:hypothetical protein